MDELKNKINEILDMSYENIGGEWTTENHITIATLVDQIVGELKQRSKSYPSDYLREYGRTVHRGGDTG